MRINYNVTGTDRKALVRAMVELLGEPPVYQGAPGFAYSSLTPGTKGTVRSVDDTGTVFVRWDNGSGLGVVYGVDRIRKL